MDAEPTAQLAAAILNAAWMVRHYRRGAKMTAGNLLQEQRAQAILRMGLTIRHAFNKSDDFEPLLVAIHNGLTPQGYEPPF